jgi:hypothetical protein
MKKSLLICLMLFNIHYVSLSQNISTYKNGYKCLEGIWQGRNQTKEPFADIKNTIMIFKENKYMIIYLNDTVHTINNYYFQSLSSKPVDIKVNLEKLGSSSVLGLEEDDNKLQKEYYFTKINSVELSQNNFSYNIWPNLECDQEELYFFYSEYVRIDSLPHIAIKKMLMYSQKDNKDYLKEFLNITLREVKSPKAFLYYSPNNISKMFLIKSDRVEIVEKKSEYLKIKYYGGNKLIEAWILESDLK